MYALIFFIAIIFTKFLKNLSIEPYALPWYSNPG